MEKLLKAGFIRPCKHLQWLSNIVPVEKKNRTIQCCVDYKDLNKAYPKDEFPLLNIDTLIDTTIGHEMFLLWMVLAGITKHAWLQKMWRKLLLEYYLETFIMWLCLLD